MNTVISLSTINVFSRGPLLGNKAIVAISDNPEPGSLSLKLIRQINEAALCFVSPDHAANIDDRSYTDGAGYQVRCFSPSGPISFCGHGLMAAAHKLFSLHQSSSIRLLSGKQQFIAEKTSQGVKLFCPRITTLLHRAPTHIKRCFDLKPEHIASAGGKQGYWIFNFADGTDLNKLRIDHARLKHCGKRAVIVTSLCEQRKATKNTICRMRYFAPQYGAREDQATGSACVIVADFWQKKLREKSFTIVQQSKDGGFMTVECNHDTIALAGNTQTIGHNEWPL